MSRPRRALCGSGGVDRISKLANLIQFQDRGLSSAGHVDPISGGSVNAAAARAEAGTVVDDANACLVQDLASF